MAISRPIRSLALGVLILSIATTAWAEVKGRAFGQLTDENGDPVAGAQIVVTDPELTNFRLEDLTDKKGKYKILFVDATRSYQIEFSKEGYQTIQAPLKIPAGSSTRLDYTILSEAAAMAQANASDPSAAAIATFNEAGSLANMGDYHGAQVKFREAIELDPTLAAAHSGLATALKAMGDLSGAIEAAEAATAIDAEDTRALKILVESYEALGEMGKAAKAKEALLAANPQAAVGELFKEAAALYNDGDMAAAEPLLQQVVELRENHAKAHYLLGVCRINSGDIEGAKTHLGRFIELAPNDPDAAVAQEMINSL